MGFKAKPHHLMIDLVDLRSDLIVEPNAAIARPPFIGAVNAALARGNRRIKRVGPPTRAP
jgi:hypothetical protein